MAARSSIQEAAVARSLSHEDQLMVDDLERVTGAPESVFRVSQVETEGEWLYEHALSGRAIERRFVIAPRTPTRQLS